jgi:hypothetical protein
MVNRSELRLPGDFSEVHSGCQRRFILRTVSIFERKDEGQVHYGAYRLALIIRTLLRFVLASALREPRGGRRPAA